MSKPFAHLAHNQAAENNKAVIHDVLSELDLLQQTILEIGSGTGQQGIYFCQQNEKLIWQPTEVETNLANLRQWYKTAQTIGLSNFLSPVQFEVGVEALPEVDFDAVYSSNVLHIVSKALAETLIQQVTQVLKQGQLLICYGPFKKDGEYTTDSNRQFDAWLQQQGYGGINDLTDVINWSNEQLSIKHLCDMPANNFLVVYQKQ